MAYTVSMVTATIWGNKLVKTLSVTADAASGAVATGLNVVDFIAGITPVSMATAAAKFKINLSAASAAANGSILVSSAASGDNFVIVAVGH